MACCDGINIFSGGAGRVIAIDDDTAIPIAFTVDGLQASATFNDLKAIVTSIGISAQEGFQMMHGLREMIFVYVFTSRVGEITISGLAFPDSCASLTGDAYTENNCTYGATGLERVMAWYQCNRITTRAEPILISLGAASPAYHAFLVSMKAEIADASTGIAQFSMRFNYIPQISELDTFCFSDDLNCLDYPCVTLHNKVHTTNCYIG